MDESIDHSGLQDMFQKFGNVLSCKVAMSEDGKSKGYGFVQFESEESANDAIEKLNGSTVGEKQMYVQLFLMIILIIYMILLYTNYLKMFKSLCACMNIVYVFFLFILPSSLV